jgi:outer membrane murein-binding lipoprotein Lpp
MNDKFGMGLAAVAALASVAAVLLTLRGNRKMDQIAQLVAVINDHLDKLEGDVKAVIQKINEGNGVTTVVGDLQAIANRISAIDVEAQIPTTPPPADVPPATPPASDPPASYPPADGQ